jgi:predicted dehydrogenase
LVDGHYRNTDCKLVSDFRELLDRKDIDAVLIATGDRWRAGASMMAAEAGKDVYSEKPCGLSIDLCQRLDDTFQRRGRIVDRSSMSPALAVVRVLSSLGTGPADLGR